MGRRKNLIPTEFLTVGLPLDVHTQMTAHLYSELEGRVPLGSYQRFLSELIRAYFSDKRLDLAPYVANAPSGAFIIHGSPEAILAAKYALEKS
jgi:hypothetical protein